LEKSSKTISPALTTPSPLAKKEKTSQITDETVVAALAEQEKARKKAEEKKKSNLELFKEELKRY
jgi:hypothetical protein